MPYKLRKAPKRDLYWVVTTETGKKHSKLPIALDKAKAQMRILEAQLSGGISKAELRAYGAKYFTDFEIKLIKEKNGDYSTETKFRRIQLKSGDLARINELISLGPPDNLRERDPKFETEYNEIVERLRTNMEKIKKSKGLSEKACDLISCKTPIIKLIYNDYKLLLNLLSVVIIPPPKSNNPLYIAPPAPPAPAPPAPAAPAPAAPPAQTREPVIDRPGWERRSDGTDIWFQNIETGESVWELPPVPPAPPRRPPPAPPASAESIEKKLQDFSIDFKKINIAEVVDARRTRFKLVPSYIPKIDALIKKIFGEEALELIKPRSAYTTLLFIQSQLQETFTPQQLEIIIGGGFAMDSMLSGDAQVIQAFEFLEEQIIKELKRIVSPAAGVGLGRKRKAKSTKLQGISSMADVKRLMDGTGNKKYANKGKMSCGGVLGFVGKQNEAQNAAYKKALKANPDLPPLEDLYAFLNKSDLEWMASTLGVYKTWDSYLKKSKKTLILEVPKNLRDFLSKRNAFVGNMDKLKHYLYFISKILPVVKKSEYQMAMEEEEKGGGRLSGQGKCNCMVPQPSGRPGRASVFALTCIDPRFAFDVAHFLNLQKDLHQDYDLFTSAGASVGAQKKEWTKAFFDNLALGIQLHGISEVWCFDHLDCGMYMATFGLKKDKDPKIHIVEMNKLEKLVKKKHPSLKFRKFMVDGRGKIEEVTGRMGGIAVQLKKKDNKRYDIIDMAGNILESDLSKSDAEQALAKWYKMAQPPPAPAMVRAPIPPPAPELVAPPVSRFTHSPTSPFQKVVRPFTHSPSSGFRKPK